MEPITVSIKLGLDEIFIVGDMILGAELFSFSPSGGFNFEALNISIKRLVATECVAELMEG